MSSRIALALGLSSDVGQHQTCSADVSSEHGISVDYQLGIEFLLRGRSTIVVSGRLILGRSGLMADGEQH